MDITFSERIFPQIIIVNTNGKFRYFLKLLFGHVYDHMNHFSHFLIKLCSAGWVQVSLVHVMIQLSSSIWVNVKNYSTSKDINRTISK